MQTKQSPSSFNYNRQKVKITANKNVLIQSEDSVSIFIPTTISYSVQSDLIY